MMNLRVSSAEIVNRWKHLYETAKSIFVNYSAEDVKAFAGELHGYCVLVACNKMGWVDNDEIDHAVAGMIDDEELSLCIKDVAKASHSNNKADFAAKWNRLVNCFNWHTFICEQMFFKDDMQSVAEALCALKLPRGEKQTTMNAPE